MSTWSRWVRILGISVAGSLVLATGASAAVVFNVNSTLDKVDDNVGDGECHTAAGTCTLRAAVMEANLSTGTGATIVLPAGTYLLTRPATGADGPDSGDLNLTTPAGGNPVISIIGAGQTSTIIDANQLDRVLTADSGRTAMLSRLTLRNGYVPGAVDGGGIRNSGSLTLNRCTVSGNVGGVGGGISTFNALYLSDCTISGNSSRQQGGGIYSSYGFVSIERTTITANVAAYDAGGIAHLGELYITASTIALNTAHRDGGGIYSPEGGAFEGDLTLVNTTLYGNSADRNGGGIYFGGPPPFNANAFNSTIAFNGADADADQDGGNGGGIYVAAGSVFYIRNTLVVGNTLFNQPIYEDCWGALSSYGTNLFWEPGGACVIVPQTGIAWYLNSLDRLGPLQKNGGLTKTIALLPGSNAIDAGDPELGCIGPDLATDQRGARRVFGARCDVGAYEAGILFFDGFESGDLAAW